jgi:protein-tyrosine phosphatase
LGYSARNPLPNVLYTPAGGAASLVTWAHMRAALFTVATAGPGRLSTMARPRGGELLSGEMTALRQAGVDVLVCMLTASELLDLELDGEAAAASAAGLRFVALATPDRGLPPAPAPFQALVADLVGELERDRHVVVHCRMGIGRSSMVAGAVLMARGMPALDAWAAISRARGLTVPDTPEQRRWVENVMGPAGPTSAIRRALGW